MCAHEPKRTTQYTHAQQPCITLNAIRTNAFIAVCGVLCLVPYGVHAVTISEVAWMGTQTSANDEWIELYNTAQNPVDLSGWQLTDSDDLVINLSGMIAGGAYAVLERTNDDSAPGTAFLIYTGALSNSGATLTLTDADGTVVDQVAGGTDWERIGGDNETKETAQYAANGWVTDTPTPGDGARTTTSSGANDTSAQSTKSSNTTSDNDTTNSGNTGQSDEAETSGGGGGSSNAGETSYDPALLIRAPEEAYPNQEVTFTTVFTDMSPRIEPSMKVAWNFGDLHTAYGKTVRHTFSRAGTYRVRSTATFARIELEAVHDITVLPVRLDLSRLNNGDILIENTAPYAIDLSGYTLRAHERMDIPDGTTIHARGTIPVPFDTLAGMNESVGLFDAEGTRVAALGHRTTATNAPPARQADKNVTKRHAVKTNDDTSTAGFTFQTVQAVAAENGETAIAATPPATATEDTQTTDTQPDTERLAYLGLIGVLLLGVVGIFARGAV